MRKYLLPNEIKKLSSEEMNSLTKKPSPEPFYTEKETICTHLLHYSWAGWHQDKENFPDSIYSVIKQCTSLWRDDGFELLTADIHNDMIQICFKINNPEIAPVKFTRKVKGRIDHAFRQIGTPIEFSRKIGFRCLGENTRKIVNSYIDKQVGKSDFIDLHFKDFLKNYTVIDESIDLSKPFLKTRGRYWFNIHLVLVIAEREFAISEKETFELIKNYIPKIADKRSCQVAHFAIMPDHIHISMKGNPEISPSEIGLTFMNELAYAIGCKCWSNKFYTGVFSEYELKKLLGG